MAESFSVSELTDYIALKLKSDGLLYNIEVHGEVSNFAVSRGHAYFSLKDSGAVIRCCYFSIPSEARELIEDGAELLVQGRLDVYKKGGTYNINVRSVKPVGIGALARKFELLKKELTERGYFDAELKKPLPKLPQKVGIVTSPTGAALQDIKRVAAARFAGVELIVYPAKVQGVGAGKEVAAGVRFFNERLPVDVIIVARGGGSYEELFEFNDEDLVKAVFESRVPVVSGVGHEVDVSLCDLAADVRAATPSNAAELVIPKKESLLDGIHALQQRMAALTVQKLHRAKTENARLTAKLKSASPLVQTVKKKNELTLLTNALHTMMKTRLNGAKSELDVLKERLLACDVFTILNRGYLLARKGEHYVASVADISQGDTLILRLKDGAAEVAVMSVSGGKQ